MRKLIGFLFVLLPYFSISQNVEISGNALFFAEEGIEVLSYSNRISHTLNTLTQTSISENGDYKLLFELDAPQEVLIRIEMRDFPVIIYPNTHLEINFLPLSNGDNQQVPFRTGVKYLKKPVNTATLFDYQNLQLDFAEYQSHIELGMDISIFYTQFFDSIKLKYDTIILADHQFSNHLNYFKANSLLQSEISKTKLFNTFINHQPILYDDPDFLRLFSTLTGMRIFNHFKKNKLQVEQSIKEYKVYEELMEVLATDTLFLDHETRSLALLLYSIRPRNFPEIPNDIWSGVINQMSNFCMYPEQKLAAFEIQKNRNTLLKGSEAPEIELTNSKGERVYLSSFRGRHTYLGFINSKSRTCVNDLQVIQKIKPKYRRVNYVFVICDRDSLEMVNLPKESSNLKYLFINKSYAALKEYKIWNFPVYYFLDKHGYFLQSPAQRPSEIIGDFQLIFAKKPTRKRYEIIKK